MTTGEDHLGRLTMSDKERLLRLEINFAQLSKDFEEVKEITDALNTQSMYVRGALVVAVAVGGIIAWGTDIWKALVR